jgi:predicted nucleic acid-binding protein
VRAVSDTSPLCYLLLIDKIDLFPVLFERVFAPRAVALELSHPAADARIRAWIADPPAWLRILDAPEPALGLSRLGPGESEAISLAKALRVDFVIHAATAGSRTSKTAPPSGRLRAVTVPP